MDTPANAVVLIQNVASPTLSLLERLGNLSLTLFDPAGKGEGEISK